MWIIVVVTAASDQVTVSLHLQKTWLFVMCACTGFQSHQARTVVARKILLTNLDQPPECILSKTNIHDVKKLAVYL